MVSESEGALKLKLISLFVFFVFFSVELLLEKFKFGARVSFISMFNQLFDFVCYLLLYDFDYSAILLL